MELGAYIWELKLNTMNDKMIALFQEGIGQTTQFLDPKECLQFPYDNTRKFWYEDKKGNKYSFFEAMSKFYK